ncbi:MAG TPA: cytochrome c peroxidase [Polyangia bacterium]|jgi:cytochrome c peroxidase|nr:cytochrome c peroxidase [Polyangia bacterium]
MSHRRARILFATVGVVAMGSCRAKPTAPIAATSDASTSVAAAKSFYADRFSRKPTVSAMTELGRRLFFDPALSASGAMACATCHDPAFAYGPPNDRSTQLGGVDGKSVGLRAAPALRYLQTVPPFAEHHFDEGVDESIDRGPTGGHGWDGRADTTHDQARLPLTSKFEMANVDVDSVVARVARGALAARFRAVFGDDVFADPVRGSTALLLCLEVFQQSPKDFYPYRSRYDAYLRKQLELDPAELRGLALFNSPTKGNCASCHPSQITHDGFPNFTDFGFNAIGVPRNRALPANADPAFHDLGLCGPIRTDLGTHQDYCGEFRVPSLRNVTLRRSFFHNGVFHRLEQVLEFYAERDTDPAKWYAKVDGRVAPFDDLPAAFHKNVNREGPFGGKPGTKPALGKSEMRDIIAFLATLTDADLTKK